MPSSTDNTIMTLAPSALPTTITSQNLAPTTNPLTPGTAPSDTTNYSGIVKSVADNLGSLTDSYNKATVAKGNTQGDIESILASLTGKAADTAQVNKDTGVTDLSNRLLDLNSQAKQLTAAASAIPIQTQENNKNTGATDAGVAPQTAGALRLNALKALSISQQADIATGALGAATAKANQIIDLKYKPLEDELAARKQQYEFNKDNLSQIDAKRTEALGISLKEQETALATKKADEIAGSTLLVTMRGNGLPDDLAANLAGKSQTEILGTPGIAKYLNTGSFSHFTDLTGKTVIYNTKTGKPVGTYGGSGNPVDPTANSALLPANNYTVSANDTGGLTQIAKANGTDVETLKQLNPNLDANSTVNPGDKLILPPKENPNATYQQYGLLTRTNFNPKDFTDANAVRYLNQFLQGNTPSARTLGLTGGALTLAANRASQLYSAATGDPLPPNPELLKTNTQLIAANNKLLNNLSVQEKTINSNFGLNLDNLKANNMNTAIPIFNGIFNGIDNALGSPGTAQYNLQNSTLQNEAGSLMAVKNAAGTTVFDKMVGAQLIPKNATQDQQIAVLKTLLQEAKNAQSSITGTNSDLYKTIDPLQMSSDNPNRQAYLTQKKLGPLNFSTSNSSGPDLSTFNFKLQ